MDLESFETQTLLKKRTPKRQGLALKLAVLLCGLGLIVGVAVPSTNQVSQGAATLKEKEKVTATAGVSSTSRPASTMSMDWRAAAVTSTGRSQRRKPPAPRRSSKLGSRGRSSLRRFPDSGLSARPLCEEPATISKHHGAIKSARLRQL